ncbi:hypothetical protein BHM03_00031041, partial [Ensete ventricosum]
MAESYGGRAVAAAWGEGVARHTTLMGVELGSVVPGHLHLGYQIDCRPGPESSSSGVMTGADAKALQALEAMKLHHDFDSTVYLESLGSVRKRFSIPSEYVLHAPRSGQQPYHPCPRGFGISIDTLEAWLRFPLHPVIGECLNWWGVSPGQIAPNSWHYIITFIGECKGSGIVPSQDLFLSCFRLCRGQGGYYLTAKLGFRVGGAPSNNKGWKARFLS